MGLSVRFARTKVLMILQIFYGLMPENYKYIICKFGKALINVSYMVIYLIVKDYLQRTLVELI